jgi:hypothetical protein
MKRTTLWLAASLAALGAGSAAAQYQSSPYGNRTMQAQIVRCESVDSRQAMCRIPSGSDVRLVNQISRQSCVEGRNWGHDATRIIVADGCRADFQVTDGDRYGDNRYDDNRRDDNRYDENRRDDDRYDNRRYGAAGYADRSGQQLHCASQSRYSRRTYCGSASGDYSLVGRSANCVEGRTWGNADRGVWVSGRCSANFRLTSYDNNGRDWRDNRGDTPRHQAVGNSMRCESLGDWRTYCGDSRDGPYSLREVNNYCVQGTTWGNDARGLWVRGQCKAEFYRPYLEGEPRTDMHPYVEGMSQVQRY